MCITDQEFDETYDEILRILLDDLEQAQALFRNWTKETHENTMKKFSLYRNKVYQQNLRIRLFKRQWENG